MWVEEGVAEDDQSVAVHARYCENGVDEAIDNAQECGGGGLVCGGGGEMWDGRTNEKG